MQYGRPCGAAHGLLPRRDPGVMRWWRWIIIMIATCDTPLLRLSPLHTERFLCLPPKCSPAGALATNSLGELVASLITADKPAMPASSVHT